MLKRFLIAINFAVLLGAVLYAQQPVTIVSGTTAVTATNLDVQIGGSDTVQVQSNSANLATAAKQDTLQTAIDTINANIADGVATNSIKHFVSAGSTEDENQVKATPGVLAGISATNNHATADAFLRCVNKTAANTTPGSETIFYGIMVPHLGGIVDRGIEASFSVALTCYVVLGEAENDVAEVSANDVNVNVSYR